MKKGTLFVFEGPDNVGKSTAIKRLSLKLEDDGVPYVSYSFPGKELGTLGKLVYEFHNNPMIFGVSEVNPISLQLLHVSAHIDSINRFIIPSLNEGKVVLLDRYWWSTYVYGIAAGINEALLEDIINLESKYWQKYRPKVIFLLDRIQDETQDKNDGHHSILTEEYKKLSLKEQGKSLNVKLINNNENMDHLLKTLYGEMNNYIKRKRKIRGINQKTTYPLININVKKKLPRTSHVYDTYWKFAAERQEIFFKKAQQMSAPWTDDIILNKYKFTNAYRASDRVSQYLIKNVIYNKKHSVEDLFFRILLFKTFNKIETWELIERELGQISYSNYSFKLIDQLLLKKMYFKEPIYSAAYIMASGKNTFGYSKKHQNHLKLLELMMEDELPTRLTELKKMENVYQVLLSYSTIGSFLAYQYCIDLNYSDLINFGEMDFIVPGPGAKDGIKKCFYDLGDFSESEIIIRMAEHQDEEFSRLGINFKSLWGRKLQLIDCQNLFCEVDKYSRIAHPEIKGLSNRSRIKQTYTSSGDALDYWYPPKWEINSSIE